jgi:hypothetical protein
VGRALHRNATSVPPINNQVVLEGDGRRHEPALLDDIRDARCRVHVFGALGRPSTLRPAWMAEIRHS